MVAFADAAELLAQDSLLGGRGRHHVEVIQFLVHQDAVLAGEDLVGFHLQFFASANLIRFKHIILGYIRHIGSVIINVSAKLPMVNFRQRNNILIIHLHVPLHLLVVIIAWIQIDIRDIRRLERTVQHSVSSLHHVVVRLDRALNGEGLFWRGRAARIRELRPLRLRQRAEGVPVRVAADLLSSYN